MKPSVYLDTSVISACWYKGDELTLLARRLHTTDWWNLERRHFAVWGSPIVEMELSAGTFPQQEDCIRMARRLRYLQETWESRQLAKEVIEQGIVPAAKPSDATHLAISATHEIDFLLTWNYAHMANPVVQERFAELCERLSLRVPLMVSPETIPQVRFGQSIRRKRHG